MEQVTPLPSHGTVFFDERDQGRSLRLSYHQDSAVFVISLWRIDLCLGTFRLPAEDAARKPNPLTGRRGAGRHRRVDEYRRHWRDEGQSGADAPIGPKK